MDLEQRGLLQHDPGSDLYDLHPVVRAVALRATTVEERDRQGWQVVDHFSARQQDPHGQAVSLADLSAAVTVVRTLHHLGEHERAVSAYMGELSAALIYNLEAYGEVLALIQPFFPDGWDQPVPALSGRAVSYFATDATIALNGLGALDQAYVAATTALGAALRGRDRPNITIDLDNLGRTLLDQRRLAASARCRALELKLALAGAVSDLVFMARLSMFEQYRLIGYLDDAEQQWTELSKLVRPHRRSVDAELQYAWFLFQRGTLRNVELDAALDLATASRNRIGARGICELRGRWLVEREEWSIAAPVLEEAVRMARETNIPGVDAEIRLALAHHHLGRLADPHETAEHLARHRHPAQLPLGHLWRALGETDRAIHHADLAYRWAWADGEPYVFRHDLDQAAALLTDLGAPIPDLPPYDPANDPPFDWEGDVATAIEELQR